jgi:ABC-type Fe3+ transport system substrate-binding protein
VIGYNTNWQAGGSTQDLSRLLNPKWKNDLSIDTEPEQAVFAWLLEWGEEKTAEYMKALMRNGTVARNGHTCSAAAVQRRDQNAVEVYAARVAQMKHDKGALWDEFYQPGARLCGSHGGSPRAPEPHAAAL